MYNYTSSTNDAMDASSSSATQSVFHEARIKIVRTQEDAPGAKRRKIGGEDDEEEKRKKMAVKEACLEYMVHACEWFRFMAFDAILPINRNTINIDNYSDCLNNFKTVHNILRQEANGSGGMLGKMESKECLEFNNASFHVALDAAIVEINKIAELYGLKYTKPAADDKDHWFGVIAPMISLTIGFKFRLGEVKIIPTAFKLGALMKDADLVSYGIYRYHACLMEGMTYPPSVRSAIAQSLGRATIIMCLVTAKSHGEEKYSTKWVNAFTRAFSHIKDAETIGTIGYIVQ